MLYDTITALATPYGTGAIAIIRLSGEKTFPILKKVFTGNLDKAATNSMNYGYLKDPQTGKVIDEVLVAIYRHPHSYTGEDLAEINLHGGTFVVNTVLSLLISNGAIMAQRGEFTLRAYLHGKMDLTQAEAINDLIEAQHLDQLTLATDELRGSVSKLIKPLLEEMVTTIGNIEVNIDYPEYQDVKVLSDQEVKPMVDKWLKDLKQILAKAESGKIVREGILTAIIGKPNVGKSSLLNALLEEDKAIVTDIPGTTRDIVEGEIRLQNVTLKLMDTAGIRQTKDTVEMIGVDRSLDLIKKAQLILLVIDNSKPLDNNDQELLELTKDKNRIIVYNKADLKSGKEGVETSALKGEIEPLIKKINEMYETVHADIQDPTMSNPRQIGLLNQAYSSLQDAKKSLIEGRELDLVQVDINQAHDYLREIIGKYTKEDLLDDIFSRFCLGK